MKKSILLMFAAFVLTGSATLTVDAQTGRKSVSGKEVTGTFRYTFAGKFRGSSSDIKILALGHGKVRLGFELVYPHLDGHGDLTANMGYGGGDIPISGDTAVYNSDEFGPCTITIRFVKPGTIKVTQEGSDADCGFGHNVMAGGTYRKVSSKKPKFDN